MLIKKGTIFLGPIFLGPIFFGTNFLGSNFMGQNFLRQIFWGPIFWGPNFLWPIFLGQIFRGPVVVAFFGFFKSCRFSFAGGWKDSVRNIVVIVQTTSLRIVRFYVRCSAHFFAISFHKLFLASPQSFSVPGIMFQARRNIHLIYELNLPSF